MLRGSLGTTALVVQFGIGAASAQTMPAVPVDQVHSTRVYVGKCMMTDQQESALLTAVGVAVLGSLVTAGLNYLGSQISDAAAKKTMDVTADGNFVASRKEHPSCFQIIRGRFPSPAKPYDEASGIRALDGSFASWASTTFTKNSAGRPLTSAAISRLAENGVDVVGPPDFFFEGYLRPADTGKAGSTTAYAVAPLATWYGKPLFKGGSERGITVTAAFFDPGSDPTKAAAALFDLGMRTSSSRTTGSMPPDGARQSFGNAQHHRPIVGESQWIPNPFPKDDGPVTLRVKVSETRGEQAFLKFVSDVFNGAKGGVAAAVQTAYVPKTAEQISTSLATQSEFVTATAAARSALSDYCMARMAGASDAYAKGIVAKAAILKLGAAAAKAELDPPFAKLPSLLDRDGTAAANDTSCSQIGM